MGEFSWLFTERQVTRNENFDHPKIYHEWESGAGTNGMSNAAAAWRDRVSAAFEAANAELANVLTESQVAIQGMAGDAMRQSANPLAKHSQECIEVAIQCGDSVQRQADEADRFKSTFPRPLSGPIHDSVSMDVHKMVTAPIGELIEDQNRAVAEERYDANYEHARQMYESHTQRSHENVDSIRRFSPVPAFGGPGSAPPVPPPPPPGPPEPPIGGPDDRPEDGRDDNRDTGGREPGDGPAVAGPHPGVPGPSGPSGPNLPPSGTDTAGAAPPAPPGVHPLKPVTPTPGTPGVAPGGAVAGGPVVPPTSSGGRSSTGASGGRAGSSGGVGGQAPRTGGGVVGGGGRALGPGGASGGGTTASTGGSTGNTSSGARGTGAVGGMPGAMPPTGGQQNDEAEKHTTKYRKPNREAWSDLDIPKVSPPVIGGAKADPAKPPRPPEPEFEQK